MSRLSFVVVCLVTMLACLLEGVSAHGRMLEPPSRMSAYLAGFPTPKNYEDHQMNCGGISMQWDKNGGRCGICGDPWSQHPRPYERPDGPMVQHHVITKTYLENESIKVSVQLTQNHRGWFEFRLCDIRTSGGVEADQACLDRTVLADDTGKTQFESPSGNGVFDFFLVLPPGMTCPQCVFQWKWHCGNNWGCDDTGCGLGKAKRQEEFYACADVKIDSRNGQSPPASPDPNPDPIRHPAAVPVPDPKPNPVVIPAPKPNPNPVAIPVPDPKPNPVVIPAPKPNPNPVAIPVPDPVPHPNPHPHPQPISNPPHQPVGPKPVSPGPGGGRVSGIPAGFSSYREYLQNMFSTATNAALKYTNKVRVPATGVGKHDHPFDRQFLEDVVGYPASDTDSSSSNIYPGTRRRPGGWRGGLPTYIHAQPTVDQDSVDRLCAACFRGCRFSACSSRCPGQCRR